MTHSSIIKVSSNRIISWMNAIRNSSGKQQDRLLESFWESQLSSKGWLVNVLKTLDLKNKGDVYIFGGWYGILASLIKDEFTYQNVYSIDIDESCKEIGSTLDNRIKFVTGDMGDFIFTSNNIGLVINTSTEHITQYTFDKWISNIPNNVPIVLQGNDFFGCAEHVRCVSSLEQFVMKNKLETILYKGTLDCKQFTRFMVIGYKNEY